MDTLVALKLIFFGGQLGLLGVTAVAAFAASRYLDWRDRRVAEGAWPARPGVPAFVGGRAPAPVAPGRCSS